MNKLIIILLTALSIVSCSKSKTLSVSNPLSIDRSDETIVLKRSDLETKFGVFNEGFAPIVLLNGLNIPSQVDDMDGDSKWDEDGFKIIAQGESVSWENDKMAFRNYFDCRNIKDLFGKLKPGLVLDDVHTAKIPNYHVLSDWGMDVLHCGSSLGSGGLAMLEGDSLYRLGSTKSYVYQMVIILQLLL
jgi:hypothetical protein